MHRTTRRTTPRVLAASGTLVAVLLAGVGTAGADGHGQGHGQGHGPGHAEGRERPAATATEDTDGNDGDTPDDVADAGDDQHPSGRDRSVEPGGSGNQGRASADPDDDGRGPDRSNGGADRPDGPGGEDLADQDGNNGCGNDDDFEDDNEGWCGRRPERRRDETPAAPTPGSAGSGCPGAESMSGGHAACDHEAPAASVAEPDAEPAEDRDEQDGDGEAGGERPRAIAGTDDTDDEGRDERPRRLAAVDDDRDVQSAAALRSARATAAAPLTTSAALAAIEAEVLSAGLDAGEPQPSAVAAAAVELPRGELATTAAAASASAGALAFTGFGTTWTVLAALVLIVAGLVMRKVAAGRG
jgi:hypothetical protein